MTLPARRRSYVLAERATAYASAQRKRDSATDDAVVPVAHAALARPTDRVQLFGDERASVKSAKIRDEVFCSLFGHGAARPHRQPAKARERPASIPPGARFPGYDMLFCRLMPIVLSSAFQSMMGGQEWQHKLQSSCPHHTTPSKFKSLFHDSKKALAFFLSTGTQEAPV
eukprot:1337737-Pleurochrysis_carterae.AAC.4